jgi:hypothetical protein
MFCGDGICDPGEHGWCPDCPLCGGCGDTVTITVADNDLAGLGSIGVIIESGTELEPAMLWEDPSGIGVFRGTISLTDVPPVPDGLLSVSHGDFVLATYIDANDGLGNFDINKYATANVYCDPLVISNVRVIGTQGSSALLAWNTNYPSKSYVQWFEPDLCPACPAVIAESERFGTIHGAWISNLSPCTSYAFEVHARDAGCNVVVDDNNGAFYGFTTQGPLVRQPQLGPEIVVLRRGRAVRLQRRPSELRHTQLTSY